MFKWSVILFLFALMCGGLAINLDVGKTPTLSLMAISVVSVILALILFLVDKAKSDIKRLKRGWKIEQQYKRERDAEKSQLVSNGDAKKRYKKARIKHMLFSDDDDDSLNGYLPDED